MIIFIPKFIQKIEKMNQLFFRYPVIFIAWYLHISFVKNSLTWALYLYYAYYYLQINSLKLDN